MQNNRIFLELVAAQIKGSLYLGQNKSYQLSEYCFEISLLKLNAVQVTAFSAIPKT